MASCVKDLMLPLEEYAVVGEDATIREAFEALRVSQSRLPPGRQRHRAVLVRNLSGEIVGKVHYFAFLRALVPDWKAARESSVLDRAGVGDDLRASSLQTLDFLTAELVDMSQRARNVRVRDVYTAANVNIPVDATLPAAVGQFLSHQTLSLLVRRGAETVGILRLSDLFDELSNQVLGEPLVGERSQE